MKEIRSVPRRYQSTGPSGTALLLGLAFLLAGCATPTFQERSPDGETLTPWEGNRLGMHPGSLQGPLSDTRVVTPSTGQESRSAQLGRSTSAATLYLAWRLYSHTYSRVSGDTCRFSPTCSRFAVDAAPYGPTGMAATFGRLQRAQFDDPLYRIEEDHLVDPIEFYFFWRSDAGLDAHRFAMERSLAWYLFVHATKDL